MSLLLPAIAAFSTRTDTVKVAAGNALRDVGRELVR